jgi:tRNA nucleotidyltransferase (CCA-adding enzyme)
MPEPFSSFAEVKFLDYEQILAELRQAVREAKAAHPEIVTVLLFGSLVQGNWTAESDADLVVVVRKEFPDFLSSRAPYQIFARSIPTDSLVYSEREFVQMSRDCGSFLAQNLPTAIEL